MLKNTFMLLGGRIANAAFSLVLALAVSHALGPEGFGVFTFITSVVITALHLANFGLDAWLVREVSKTPETSLRFLSEAMGIKLFTSAFSFLLICLVFLTFPIPPETYRLLVLLSLSIGFNAGSQSLWHFADGQLDFRYHAGLWAASNGAKAMVGGGLVLALGRLDLLVGALVVVEAFICFFSWYCIRKQFGRFPLTLKVPHLIPLVRKIWRLALLTLVAAGYFRLGVLTLAWFGTETQIGWYGAGFRLVELFTLLPQSLFTFLFPLMVRESEAKAAELYRGLPRSAALLGGIGLAAGAFLFFLAPWVIPLVFGDGFEPGIPVLRILCGSFLFISLNYLFSHLLLAQSREALNLKLLCGVALVGLALNLALIPQMGALGAAWACVGAEALYTALMGWAIFTRPKPA